MARLAGQSLKHGDPRRVWDCVKPCEICDDYAERRRMRAPTLPVSPLLRFLPKWEQTGGGSGKHNDGYASMGGIAGTLTKSDARTLWRILKVGWITPYEADRFACLLGRHVSEIWPEWFDENVEKVVEYR